MIRIIDSTDQRAVSALLDRRPARDRRLEARVARFYEEIMHLVEETAGPRDRAYQMCVDLQPIASGSDPGRLLAFARRFDRLGEPLEVAASEIDAGIRDTPRDVRAAIRLAARHIRRVARRQVPRGWSVSPVPGVRIEQRVTPLDRVGCYVPGGRYPLPSSLLMTAIPARVAGVREVIAVCPRPDATVLCAAREAGVDRLFRIGGAQAIAALAYGTATVPKVDKIVGPGNAYVAAAKALVAADCAIDFFAGPSEIAVLSETGRAGWIAADLIAQAEHDPDARAILITPSRRLARSVAQAIRRQMPADGPAPIALSRNGGIIVSRTLDEAIALS